jgi:hypothetical protein
MLVRMPTQNRRMVLDNSASILPDYIDTEALRKEADIKDAAFLQAKESLNDAAVSRAAQGIPGASQLLVDYKTAMQSVTDWYKSKNALMKKAMSGTSADAQDYVVAFNTKKGDVEALRKKVEAERELQTIREEQVKSLENREEANYHSSWMGLEKPLKPESHVGLSVAAGAFGFVAILVVIYMYRTRSSEAPDFTSFFRGGFRAMKRLGRYSV